MHAETSQLAPHPVEGWTERREHADGVSYWRRGERHRTTGWAVDRTGTREAWLFGRHLPTPSHPEELTFGGQAADGVLEWLDAAGRLRVEQWTTAGGVEETRYLAVGGGVEAHPGGYHRVRVLRTGERRHYEATPAGPALHRLDGPAIEDAGCARRSQWLEHGVPVASPETLLNAAKRAAIAAWDSGATPGPFPLSEADAARISAAVAAEPDCVRSWELSIAFPSAWIAGMRFAGALDRPPVRG